MFLSNFILKVENENKSIKVLAKLFVSEKMFFLFPGVTSLSQTTSSTCGSRSGPGSGPASYSPVLSTSPATPTAVAGLASSRTTWPDWPSPPWCGTPSPPSSRWWRPRQGCVRSLATTGRTPVSLMAISGEDLTCPATASFSSSAT